MKKTIKLRDLTEEQYSSWLSTMCLSSTKKCSQCPFFNVACSNATYKGWINHKDLYSDKFLDQTIEVEVPDYLSDKARETLKTLLDILPFDASTISYELRKGTTWLVFYGENRKTDLNISCDFLMGSAMVANVKYSLADLGLEDK